MPKNNTIKDILITVAIVVAVLLIAKIVDKKMLDKGKPKVFTA